MQQPEGGTQGGKNTYCVGGGVFYFYFLLFTSIQLNGIALVYVFFNSFIFSIYGDDVPYLNKIMVQSI